MEKSDIPPTIWMYWDQGLEAAPEVVKICAESWKALNPEYELIVLDHDSINLHVNVDSLFPDWRSLSIQQSSDLLRLLLLAQRGGVWVDATLFCLRPLHEWLDPHHCSGVYLVDVPDSTDKLFDTFFLASAPKGQFVSRWLSTFVRYLDAVPQPMTHQMTKRLLKRIPPLKSKLGRVLFTTRLFRNRFGAPYFIVHYLGTRSLVTSARSLIVWMRRQRTMTGKFSALLRSDNPGAQLEADLEAERYPFIKLTHKALPDQVERLEAVMRVLRAWLARQIKAG